MKALSMDQLRSVASLARAVRALDEAIGTVEEAEDFCWQMGISDRQIAVIRRKSNNTISNRRRRRQVERALREEMIA